MLTPSELLAELRSRRIAFRYVSAECPPFDADGKALKFSPVEKLSPEISDAIRQYRALLVWLCKHRLDSDEWSRPQWEVWLRPHNYDYWKEEIRRAGYE